MFLHWCTLEPSGESNLAAIRFSSPIRIQSIRVFPTNAKPFSLNTDIVARTEPTAFLLDVFFNAQSIHPTVHQAVSKQKAKPANALVPTVMAYTGGQMDFRINMGAEYATRLMIVKGNFESVSLAIYGDVASEASPPVSTYEPGPVSSIEHVPLSRALDPSNSSDPTLLARELLSLISHAPPLPLVVRLIFCLKASNDDWDLPEFPYIHPNLVEDLAELDLENAFQCTSRPVSDDVSFDVLKRFAERVAASIGPKSRSQSFLAAGILSHAASQHPELARCLIQSLDLETVFEASHIDELTALRLLNAATNADVARHMNTEWFFGILNDMQSSSADDQETKKAAQTLADRVRGWQVFEDALSNTQADFHESANMMKDVGIDEQCFGIWLESMIFHDDLVTKLAENPVLPLPQPHPPPLFSSYSGSSVSHDEFIAFVRAFIGVACVLAVYAWADSVPHDRCRERALAIIRLWQGVKGYREIVNHLLLLPQMTFRLECMTSENDPPSQSGLHAEHILVDLSEEPLSMLRRGFVECILALGQPLSYITEDERLSMRSAALVADDGLPGAMEELLILKNQSMDLKRLRILRVAIAVIEREFGVDKAGEWQVLQALWREGSHGLIPHLLDIFLNVSHDIRSHFTLAPPPPMPQELLNQLLWAANDLLRLISFLLPAFPIPGRLIRTLTTAVAVVFGCTDAADMLYSQTNAACIAAQVARQTCVDLIRTLCNSHVHPEPKKPSSEVVLRTLLDYGVHSEERDPVYHIQQVFCLIDLVLPSSSDSIEPLPSQWILTDIPNVLTELRAFFFVLDTESKVHFFKRLANLDQGVTAIGEWLLLEQLKHLSWVLQSFADRATIDERWHLVQQHQIHLSLGFFHDILVSNTSSALCSSYLSADHEAAELLMTSILALFDANISSLHLVGVAKILAIDSHILHPGLRSALILILLRAVDGHKLTSRPLGATFEVILHSLKELPTEFVFPTRLNRAMSAALCGISESSTLGALDEDTAEAIFSTLEWFAKQPDAGINFSISTADGAYNDFLDRMRQLLDSTRVDDLDVARSDPVVSSGAVPSHLPESLQLPMEAIEQLLHPIISTPSTPPRKPTGQDVLGLVTISPPTAVLRSPSVIGLTKTYSNNDFRQLRQLPQNTSRLPSMHVDDFELSGSPPSLVSVPGNDVFQSLSPAFNLPQ